jgi:CBS domain containing-hemolysin-like protein
VIDGIIILDLVILLVLIALSAMFNGAEAAYFSLGRARPSA